MVGHVVVGSLRFGGKRIGRISGTAHHQVIRLGMGRIAFRATR